MRRLARLYIIKHNNERLFLQTRLANIINRYIKLRRAKRKVAVNMRWRKFAMMLLERDKPYQRQAIKPEARWLMLIRTILEGKKRKTGTTIERWVKLVTGLRSRYPDLFGDLAIARLKEAKPGDHGMAAQIRLAALARRYVRYAAKRNTLRAIGKLGKLFNRYIDYRNE